jgi:acetyltransferase-like isoleucine patch superfamily enzyme
MNSLIRKLAVLIYREIDKICLRRLVILFYPSRPEGIGNLILLKFAFFQKILGFSRSVPWPVHFTSKVVGWKNINIKKGRITHPGESIGNYIQAANGIVFGSNVRMSPNVVIVSANHDIDDYDVHTKEPPIRIGSNVWIGANSVILPGVKIGDNVIIGAGSVVNTNIPDNSIAVGNPCKVIREKAPYQGKLDD